MKKNNNKQSALILYDALSKANAKEQVKIIDSFLQIITDKSAFKKGNKIINELDAIIKKQSGVKSLEITSVHELDTAMIKKIKNIFGQNSEMTCTIDKSLLGGLVIKTDDKIFDASLKNNLKNLKNTLNN